MLKHGILGLLNYGDMTGYEIREIFDKSLNFFWQAQSSQIYRELRALEKNGWIAITTVKQTEKPNKNVCSITESGRAELLSWLSTQNPVGDTRVPLLMQVFFLGNRSKEENIAYFEDIANACRQQLASFSNIDKSIDYFEDALNLQDQSPYWKMTADFGRRSLQMHIDWAEHCAAKLRTELRSER
uniref:PadR family transcriptional regulator n=1 Tax=Collinsella bouchesdurhonensis TaxID=1907654 RepID=UPI00359C65DD